MALDGMAESTSSTAESVPYQQRMHPSDPVSCVYITFEGLKRVDASALVTECGALRDSRSLGEMQRALPETHARLDELKLFKQLDADVSVTEEGVVDIVFKAVEKVRGLSVGGDVGKRGEMSGNVKVEQPALLGGPLCASGTFTQAASAQAKEFLFRLSTPRFLGNRLDWNLDVAKATTDESEASSYASQNTHAIMRIANPAGGRSLAVEASLRDLWPSESGPRMPSAEVLASRLRSMKTSVKCSFMETWRMSTPSWMLHWRGRRDVPKIGLKADAEAAGLLGDTSFLRGEAEVGASCPLAWGMSLSCFGILGVLMQVDGEKSCPQDRFFLGGSSGSATMLKGFGYRGIGPIGACRARPKEGEDDAKAAASKRIGDALGGDAMANAFVTLSAPLIVPGKPPGLDVDARVFTFAGMGALSLDHKTDPAGIVEGLRREARASAGLGVGMPLGGGGMLELSFSRPLWARSHDLKQSWQLGLRLDWRG